MKRLFFTFLLIISTFITSHAQNYVWAKSIGDIRDDMPFSKIGIDSLENMYFAIQFLGQGYFAQDTIITTTIKNLLIKADSLGTIQYAKEIPAISTINDLKVDKQGNVYMVGTDGALITIIKYKSNGVLEYVDQPGGGSAQSLELDKDGNLIIGGQIGGWDTKYKNIFLAKQSNNDSVLLWQYYWHVEDGILLDDLKLDSHGNIIIAGTYSNTCTFTDNDSLTPNITINATQGILDRDAYFAKFSPNGKILKAKTIDKLFGTNNIEMDDKDNLYLAENSPYCWDQTCYTHTLYMSKFDSTFNMVFSKEAPLQYPNNGNLSRMIVDNNYIYLVGTYDIDDLLWAGGGSADHSFYIYKYNVADGQEIASFMEDDYAIILKDIVKTKDNEFYFVGAYRGNRNLQNITLSSRNASADIVYGKLNFNTITTGIKGNKLTESNITIYPNPTTDKVKISTGNEMLSKVIILNNLGQIFSESKINATNFDVNMSTLPTGIYTIILFSQDGFSISKRILKN